MSVTSKPVSTQWTYQCATDASLSLILDHSYIHQTSIQTILTSNQVQECQSKPKISSPTWLQDEQPIIKLLMHSSLCKECPNKCRSMWNASEGLLPGERRALRSKGPISDSWNQNLPSSSSLRMNIQSYFRAFRLIWCPNNVIRILTSRFLLRESRSSCFMFEISERSWLSFAKTINVLFSFENNRTYLLIWIIFYFCASYYGPYQPILR